MPQIPPQSVEDVLDYYSAEVIPALAAALTIDDRFPQEVLNELRNSYTHLARANTLGSDHEDYLSELDGAYRHLKRTCIDCMKVCVFTLANRAEYVVASLEEELQLPNNVFKTMSGLRESRRRLSAYEGQNPTHEALQEYKVLFNEYDQFYQSLDQQFAGDTADKRREARRARERRAERRSSVLGFFIGILASGVVALAVEFGVWGLVVGAGSSLVVALILNYGAGVWPFKPRSKS